jgi:DNA-binding LytR/AlgR family response regulator
MRALLVTPPHSPASALAQRLVACACLQLLDQVATAAEGLAMAIALRPDVMLIDPNLAPVNAAELAASLHEPAPHLVWLTPDIVWRCENGDARRARALLTIQQRPHRAPEVNQLLLLAQGEMRSLPVREIRWMELPDRRRPLLHLHVFSQHHQLHRGLQGLLTDLAPGRLLRCHPRVAAAPAQVLEALPHADGRATLQLDNGTRLACGKPFWPAMLRALLALGKRVAPVVQR